MSVVVKNISKQYGSQKAVDELSFEAKDGEILGLLGPNGAGKSTTMKMLTCFTGPSGGDAEVCGHSIIDDQLAVRNCIGYLPEHNPLYGDMYIREYLGFVADLHGIKDARNRSEEVIDFTGLTKESHKKIGMLSKGYRQRVGLAQALYHDPQVLILDEPISGLDPNQLVEIRSLIKSLARKKTVIFSTHIMQEVEQLCDRVIILNNGKLVADQLVKAGEDYQVSNLVIEITDHELRPDFQSLPGVIECQSLSKGKYVLTYDSSRDIRKDVFDIVVAKGLKILEMRKVDQSIEQIFQKVTSSNA